MTSETIVEHKPLYQEAPYPEKLADLISRLEYRPGWDFKLHEIDRGQGSKGLTLAIYIGTIDTDKLPLTIPMHVVHYMPVPPAAYNEASWRRWLFEQILLVEQHEASEFFKIDGNKPYQANHGPGYDPYTIREFTTPEEREINFRGEKGPNH